MASDSQGVLLCPYTSTTCPLLAPYSSFDNNSNSTTGGNNNANANTNGNSAAQTPVTPSACATAHSTQSAGHSNSDPNRQNQGQSHSQQTESSYYPQSYHHHQQQPQPQPQQQQHHQQHQPHQKDPNPTLYDGLYQPYSPSNQTLNSASASPYGLKDREDRSPMVPIHSLVSSHSALAQQRPPQCRPAYPAVGLNIPYSPYSRDHPKLHHSAEAEYDSYAKSPDDSLLPTMSSSTPYAPSPTLQPMPPVPFLQRPNFSHPHHHGNSSSSSSSSHHHNHNNNHHHSSSSSSNSTNPHHPSSAQQTPISLPSPSALFSNQSFIPEDRPTNSSSSSRTGGPQSSVEPSTSPYGSAAACDMEDLLFRRPDQAALHEDRKPFAEIHPDPAPYQLAYAQIPSHRSTSPSRAADQSADSAGSASGTNGEQTAFISKLWHLLSHPEYARYLKWNQAGDAFILTNSNEFAINVLPRFFRHSNVASFIRQLNLYSFQRVSTIRLLDMADSSTSTSIVPHAHPHYHNPNRSQHSHGHHRSLSTEPDSEDHTSHSDESPPSTAAILSGDSTIAASGFTHPHFKRDHPELLKLLKPRGSSKKVQSKKQAHTVSGNESRKAGAAGGGPAGNRKPDNRKR